MTDAPAPSPTRDQLPPPMSQGARPTMAFDPRARRNTAQPATARLVGLDDAAAVVVTVTEHATNAEMTAAAQAVNATLDALGCSMDLQVLVLPAGVTLQTMDLSAMNEMGWYHADQIGTLKEDG